MTSDDVRISDWSSDLCSADLAGHPAAGPVHVPRHLQDPGIPARMHRRLHHDDADRRLPWRRTAVSDVLDRTLHGQPRRRTDSMSVVEVKNAPVRVEFGGRIVTIKKQTTSTL